MGMPSSAGGEVIGFRLLALLWKGSACTCFNDDAVLFRSNIE
jgi:hypothetical protein